MWHACAKTGITSLPHTSFPLAACPLVLGTQLSGDNDVITAPPARPTRSAEVLLTGIVLTNDCSAGRRWLILPLACVEPEATVARSED
jgi:hypothetical protein